MIFIDYLQLMNSGTVDNRNGNREQEISMISRQLKALSKELNIPVLAMSQLSRAVENRVGNKPQLSDLRESGSIEQDADMVLFIHRPDFLGLSDSPEDKEKTYVIIAKHRNGETGEIPMRFKSERVKFIENEDTLVGGPVGSAMNSDFDPPYAGGDAMYNNPNF